MSYQQYSSYKDSGIEWIGEIPEHWEVRRLKNITRFVYGESLKNEDRLEGEVPVFGSNGIVGYHDKSTTMSPMIVIGRKGSFGKVAFSEIPGFPIDTTYYIDSRYTDMNIRWIYFALIVLKLDKISQDTGVPGLNRETAYEELTPLPPLPEQQTIAAFLDRETARIDTLIHKKERLIALLKEKRQALITRAVTKGLDPNVEMKDSGVEWIGEIPAHWDEIGLKHAAKVQFSNVDKHSKDNEIPVRLCNYTDVYYNDLISEEMEFMVATATKDEIRKFTISEGDVLITKDSESWDDIAVPSYVITNFDNVLCGYHLAHIKPKTSILIGKFLSSAFNAQGISDQFKVAATGVTRFGIGKQAIGNAFFPLPPIKEQQAIANFIDKETLRIDTIIEKIGVQITKLQELRQALISNAVTGKIDVREEVAV